jgi:mannose-6-phosphate isomerase-like protein (cupin superfamily)
MSESRFLGGKVIKLTLPVLQTAPSGSGGPTLKRLMLPQGELAQFYDADEPVRYLACVELKRGAVRGNHYHYVKEEWLYIVQGALSLLVEDIDSMARESIPLGAGELAIIPTRVAHAMKTTIPGQAIEFARVRFDPADIQRFRVTD